MRAKLTHWSWLPVGSVPVCYRLTCILQYVEPSKQLGILLYLLRCEENALVASNRCSRVAFRFSFAEPTRLGKRGSLGGLPTRTKLRPRCLICLHGLRLYRVAGHKSDWVGVRLKGKRIRRGHKLHSRQVLTFYLWICGFDSFCCSTRVLLAWNPFPCFLQLVGQPC